MRRLLFVLILLMVGCGAWGQMDLQPSLDRHLPPVPAIADENWTLVPWQDVSPAIRFKSNFSDYYGNAVDVDILDIRPGNAGFFGGLASLYSLGAASTAGAGSPSSGYLTFGVSPDDGTLGALDFSSTPPAPYIGWTAGWGNSLTLGTQDFGGASATMSFAAGAVDILADGNPPLQVRTPSTVSSGDLFRIRNNGTTVLGVDYAGNLTLTGSMPPDAQHTTNYGPRKYSAIWGGSGNPTLHPSNVDYEANEQVGMDANWGTQHVISGSPAVSRYPNTTGWDYVWSSSACEFYQGHTFTNPKTVYAVLSAGVSSPQPGCTFGMYEADENGDGCMVYVSCTAGFTYTLGYGTFIAWGAPALTGLATVDKEYLILTLAPRAGNYASYGWLGLIDNDSPLQRPLLSNLSSIQKFPISSMGFYYKADPALYGYRHGVVIDFIREIYGDAAGH